MSSSNGTAVAPPSLHKRRDIKAVNDPTDLRRRRTDTAMSLRKQKRDHGLAKRRHACPSTMLAKTVSAVPQTNARAIAALSNVPGLTQALKGADTDTRIEAARALRKLLSLESDPPVAEVIQAGAIPVLVLCLDEYANTDLQVRVLFMEGHEITAILNPFGPVSVAA